LSSPLALVIRAVDAALDVVGFFAGSAVGSVTGFD
jgi:hypothetical protein